MPSIQNFTLQQSLNRDAIVALLEKIGPSILLTHSQSGAFGWPVADARPDLVKAIVAVEPNGPPFFNVENVPAPEWFRDVAPQTRPWGVTADPLAYSPAAATASDLAIVQQDKPDGPDLVRCWMQRTPARLLPNLQKLPILILTAEASYHAPYDHCTVKYLEQAGVRSDVDQARRCRHPRQRSHDDAGKKQPGDRRRHVQVARKALPSTGRRSQ